MVELTVLGRFPRWVRRLILGLNIAAATAILINWWISIWPNLAASWEIASAAAALAVPASSWLTRRLDAHAEHIARRAAEHTTAPLVAHHEATREHIAALSDQIAALHAKLDQQAGGDE